MLAALVFIIGTVTGSTGLATVHYNQPPPDFTFSTAQGVQHLSALHGKPVVLNFWASWCHPCTDELKDFVRAEQVYGDRITLLTISSEPHDVAASYLRLWNISLPLVEDLSGAISKSYSVPPIPVTVVLDPEGDVSYVSVGELSWDELNTAIERALTDTGIGTPASRVLR
jgi:cytochrome c biogenesis protein CcmG, thiol:disulfide interchange protein DsbE